MTDVTDDDRQRFPLQDKYFIACDQWLDQKEDKDLLDPPPATAQYLARHAMQLLRRNNDRRVIRAGTVSDTLRRWHEQGVAIIAEDPLQFIDYTEDAYRFGITEVKRRHRSRMIAEGKQ